MCQRTQNTIAPGISAARPHDLRRTAITNLLDVTDLATTADIAGHSDANMTRRYDRRGERSRRAAVGRLHMTWERRKGLDASMCFLPA